MASRQQIEDILDDNLLLILQNWNHGQVGKFDKRDNLPDEIKDVDWIWIDVYHGPHGEGITVCLEVIEDGKRYGKTLKSHQGNEFVDSEWQWDEFDQGAYTEIIQEPPDNPIL